MTAFLETLLQMNLTASVVILAVLLARLLLRRFPRKFSYLLWVVVAFRLCVPVSLASPVSLFNIGDNQLPAQRLETELSLPQETVSLPTEERPAVSVPSPELSLPQEEDAPEESFAVPTLPSVGEKPVQTPAETPAKPASPTVDTPRQWPDLLGPALWAAGVAVVLGYGLLSWWRARRMMATAVLLEGNVYGSDRIGSPFAMGVFRPRIYVPFGLEGEAKEYILAHERYHLRRFDHVAKLFAFGLLALHWFNPLCWLAFNRMSLDMELSCDEGVLAGYDDPGVKKRYARTLLSFASEKRLPVPSPVSFSETASAKVRIKNALYWRKSSVWASVLAVALCVCLLLTCGFDPVAAEPSRPDLPSHEESVEVLPPDDLPPEPEMPAPPQDVQPPETVSHGLEYSLNEDGQSYTVVSMGACVDTELHVPSHHTDGKAVTAIGKQAFAGSQLISAYLPDSVTEVGTGAFQNCHRLKSVRLPKDAELGEGVFRYCEALEQVNLPETLYMLPGETFRGCVSLRELYLPGDLAVIGNFAMENCRALEELYLPDSVQIIQQDAFAECASLVSVRVSPYAELGNGVFQGCISLQRVNLPESMTNLPYQTFARCVRLSYVELPRGLKSVNSNAFMACTSLQEIALHQGIESIGDSAFCDSGLTRIVLPDTVTYLGAHAFQSCDSLTSVKLPKSLKLLRRYTFHGCTSLQEIDLPDALESIEDNAFGMCTSLQSIVIPAKITEIREFCFSGCVSLTEVVLPAHVKTVWNYAFSQCSNLETVTMEGVESISNLAFFHCGSLRTVTLSPAMQKIGGQAFLNCPALTEMLFGGSTAEWSGVVKSADWWPQGGRVVCTDGVAAG